jgi:hypothetical protein
MMRKLRKLINQNLIRFLDLLSGSLNFVPTAPVPSNVNAGNDPQSALTILTSTEIQS